MLRTRIRAIAKGVQRNPLQRRKRERGPVSVLAVACRQWIWI